MSDDPNTGLVIDAGDLRRHLNLPSDGSDGEILRQKIRAATALVEGYLGFALTEFEDGTPEPVLEAIRQLAASLYENREPLLIGQGIEAKELPFTVADLLSRYKQWVF